MGNEQPRTRTEVSDTQMAQAMIEGWKSLFGTEPSKEQIAILFAQNALETGSRKSMWNFNIGNIKAQKNGAYDYFYLKGPEQTSPGVWKNLNMTFRAYPTLTDGVKDYIKLLSTSQRYSNAWNHVKNPDPASFSKALKAGGYYTADESKYTKLLNSLYNKFNKSDSYEVAQSGVVETAKGPQMVAQTEPKESFFKRYLDRLKGKDGDIFDQLSKKHESSTPVAPPAVNAPVVPASHSAPSDLDSKLMGYLHQVTASEKLNKKLYKQFLPSQNIIIRVASKNYTDAIEFSRILCTALDEELMARTFIHTDNNNIEIECAIFGPKLGCFNTVSQLTESLTTVFKTATAKIGGIDIKTKLIMNKKSSYKEITLQAAQNQYRKFLLKFV